MPELPGSKARLAQNGRGFSDTNRAWIAHAALQRLYRVLKSATYASSTHGNAFDSAPRLPSGSPSLQSPPASHNPPLAIPLEGLSEMKKLLALLFISLLAPCLLAAQTAPSTAVGQTTASPEEQITNGPVAEYVSDSSCTIGWATRAPGTMTLKYGTDRAKMTQTVDASAGRDSRNHHVQLSGLTPNTRYYFQVLRNGEPISGIGTFHTVATGEQPIRSKAIIPQ
jgi:Purple acid Phosphatase, N-terminal domain